jgi:uncharacterized protein (TIGR03437 family)
MVVVDGQSCIEVPKRPGSRVILRPCAILPVLAGLVFAADGAKPVLELQVSSETIPAGGTGQIKVWLTSPQPIGKGRIIMDLDPAVISGIDSVMVLSAAGDTTGTITPQGRHLDVRFASSSGGIGRLPGLPVLVASVKVLPGVPRGMAATVTIDPSGAVWRSPASAPYEVNVKPGTLTVGQNLTILTVEPGGGVVPAGAVVRIRGTGFTPGTSVEVGGVSVSSVRFVGPEELGLILGAPAEMTGKRIRLSDPEGSQVEYVSWLRPITESGYVYNAGWTIFPLETAAAATFFVGNPPHGYAIENPNPTPVDVIQADINYDILAGLTRFTLPSGGGYSTILSGNRFTSRTRVMASAPIRMLGLGFNPLLEEHLLIADPYGVRAYYSVEPMPGSIPTHELSVTPRSLSWDWQVGSPLPATQPVMVTTADEWVDFNATATTASGGQWLEGVDRVFSASNLGSLQVHVSVNPSALTAGTYTGAITFAPIGFNIKPTAVDVSLTVRPKATGSTSGQAPRLLGGQFAELPQLVASPPSLTFIAHTEGPTPTMQMVSVMPLTVPITPTTRTESGGDWLFVNLSPPPGVRVVDVGVKPAGLAPGTYRGAISITSREASVVEVPVSLIVWSGEPPPLKLTPDRVTVGIENGGSAGQAVVYDTGGIPFTVRSSTFTFDGGNWLQGYAGPGWGGSSLRPGVHAAATTLWLDYGFPTSVPPVVLPITLMVAAGPNAPPVVATVASGASQLQGSVSPGKIISIHGLGVGPPNPTGLAIDAAGKVATNLSGLRVLFDGVPAPLLYASVPQTNVVVPYEVADRPVTTVEVEYKGTRSKGVGVPVAPAAPAIFTLGSTGLGGAAALNEDNTVNGPLNPAPRGSVIQIFATGEGVTAPAGVTGAVTHGSLRRPLLAVSVTIGGKDAQVLYAGSAPESVAGLFQVNAVVPREAAPDPALPIMLTVGSWSSQAGVTVAVE